MSASPQCGTFVPRPVTMVLALDGIPARDLCEAAAQTVATSMGLDHAFVCEDVLSVLSGCGEKAFLDEDVACGEFEARNCNCGGATQNSHQHLLSLFGARE